MQVIILKYVQLFCLTMFLSNNASCAELVIDNEVQKSYKISACMAYCLKDENKVSETKLMKNYKSNLLSNCFEQFLFIFLFFDSKVLKSLFFFIIYSIFFIYKDLKSCYEYCSNNSENLMHELQYYDAEDIGAGYSLHCRDSSKLVFKINHLNGTVDDGRKFIYLIGILETRTRFVERQAYVVCNNTN